MQVVADSTHRLAGFRCRAELPTDGTDDYLVVVDRQCALNVKHEAEHWIGAYDPTNNRDTFIRWETP